MIVSTQTLWLFVTIITVGTCAGWIVTHVVRMRRRFAAGTASHDFVFGSIIGIIIMLIGLAGVVKHHWF